MECIYCKAEYILKKNFIAKTCGCDDEERFISYDKWYIEDFKQDFELCESE
jgi:hypothetical protein